MAHLIDALNEVRLERAIGVIYRPETERLSHYFEARLPHQFDAVIHFDETQAVEPLDRTPGVGPGRAAGDLSYRVVRRGEPMPGQGQLITGVVVGAGAMYLLDPTAGHAAAGYSRRRVRN